MFSSFAGALNHPRAFFDGFLTINDREILSHAGKVSHELAVQLAEAQYETFSANRIRSDAGVLLRLEEPVKNLPKRKR